MLQKQNIFPQNQGVRKYEPPGFSFWREYGLHKSAPVGYNGDIQPRQYGRKEEAMSEYRVCRLLPYAQHLVRLAVCDVLEQEGCLDFVREGAGGAILAHVTVYGNPGRFSIAVRDGPAGTELSVTITQPRPGLSPEGQRRAENYLADRVEQLMENELRLEPLEPAERGTA